jgi:uncharacterized protein YndB with AHSA1/START domain
MQAFSSSITINAPASRVWQVVTDPASMREALNVELITEWKINGPISYVHNYEGEEWTDKGVLLELEEPRRMKFTYFPAITEIPEIPENYQIITGTITDEGERSVLHITAENIKDEFFVKRATEIWSEVLLNLKNQAESQ